MKSGVKRVILNGEPVDSASLSAMVSALSDPAILAEKGGYVFTLCFDGDQLHLGLVPSIINGERQYHYDLIVAEHARSLTGFVNPDGSVELIVKIAPGEYDQAFEPKALAAYQSAYVRFARFLVERGFPANVGLQISTKTLFEEMNMFPEPPSTIGELARQTLPADR